jgi:hypothetical protein
MRKLTASLAIVGCVVVLSDAPAWSALGVAAYDNPHVGSLTAVAGDSTGGSSATDRPAAYTPDPCVYTWISGADLPGPGGSTSGTWGYPYVSNPPSCRDALPPGVYGPPSAFWVPAGPAAAAPAPQVLAQQALSSTQLPLPTVQTWPPSGGGETNFPTWVHLSAPWAPVSATAAAGAVRVTVTATPTEMELSSFDNSDGGATYRPIAVTCPGPGAAYDPNKPYAEQHTDCSITWSWPSANYADGAYPLTITVVYQVTWAGPGGGGALPVITRSTTYPYRVGEIEALGS